MACTDCLLNGEIQVPYKGNTSAEIIWVGESPGKEEENANPPECFIGRSGQELMIAINNAQIPIHICRFINSAKCLINKKALSKKEINGVLRECRPYLEDDILVVRPRLIVVLGAIALEQIMGAEAIKGTFNKDMVGKILYSEEFQCPVLVCNHPAAMLYDPVRRKQFSEVINYAGSYMRNDYNDPSGNSFSYREVQSIRPLLDGGLPQDSKGHYLTALDTETQGVEWYRNSSVIISYSIASSFTEGWQVYLHEEAEPCESDFEITIPRGGTKKNPEYVTVGVKRSENYEQKVAELRELLSRSDIKTYYANMKFEKHRWYNLGIIDINNINFDCLLGAHTLDSEKWLNCSLDDLVIEHDPEFSSHFRNIMTKTDKADMLMQAKIDREKFTKYASYDAIASLRVGRKVRELILQDKKLANYYARCVHPIETELLFEIERNGVLLDKDRIPQVAQEINEAMAEQERIFRSKCPQGVIDRHQGEQFRLTRDIIIKEALFDFTSPKTQEFCDYGYHLHPEKVSQKTGMPSADKEVVQNILAHTKNKNVRSFLESYLEWKSLHTLKTRYIENIIRYITEEGRVHPSYSITFTSSGRTGARSPSIQNFPKRGPNARLIRQLMVAPDGKYIAELDHHTLEVRIIAHVANDRAYIEVYHNDGDPHLEEGLKYSSKPLAELTAKEIKQLRQKTKPINFGLPYRMSPAGLQNYAKTFGIEMSDRQAQNTHNQYFAEHPDIVSWHNWTQNELHKKGGVRTILGRFRHLPDIFSNNRGLQNRAIRIGVNVQIQNPASDLTLLGGLNVIRSDAYKNDPNFKAVIFLHDALFFEFDTDNLEKYIDLCKDGLENIDFKSMFGFKLRVPLKAEAEYGYNLANTEEI